MKNNKGFTLVELLVVIAIIAVLSAIAIVNLNSARNKGNDAAVKANMAALPAGGELYRDNTGSYSGFCIDTSIDGIEANVTDFECYDTATGWAALGPLETQVFCIDSTGFQTTSVDGVTATTSVGAMDGFCNK